MVFDEFSASDLQPAWNLLEKKANGSFFLSWHWVFHWLCSSDHCRQVVYVKEGQRIVALGVLTKAKTVRPLGGSMSIFSLHENGLPDEDSISVEYNGLLCDPGYEISAHAAVAKQLAESKHSDEPSLGWLEVRWPGCTTHVFQGIIQANTKYRLYHSSKSPYVNLAIFSGSPLTYLPTRSANTRYQIRRAMRLLESEGELRLERATSTTQALALLDEMAALHQATWQARGKPGAFASDFFYSFHRSFISENIESGIVDLLSVKAGKDTVGVLYNFVYNGEVYAYQSGFASYEDNRLKPGLVCHTLAIHHYVSRNLRKYKLLAGDYRYKRSLATDSESLYWVAMQKPDLQMRFENALRSIKARVKGGGPR